MRAVRIAHAALLPPGLQKRLSALPRHPDPPHPTRRGVLNGHVLLVEAKSWRVLDIIKDVLK
jgi:hypothetical protein